MDIDRPFVDFLDSRQQLRTHKNHRIRNLINSMFFMFFEPKFSSQYLYSFKINRYIFIFSEPNYNQ